MDLTYLEGGRIFSTIVAVASSARSESMRIERSSAKRRERVGRGRASMWQFLDGGTAQLMVVSRRVREGGRERQREGERPQGRARAQQLVMIPISEIIFGLDTALGNPIYMFA